MAPSAIRAAAGLAALLVAGCSRQPAAALSLAVAQPPRNLDPRLAGDATSERVNRLLYARLVEFDAASRPVPGLATWQQVTPTRWRFTLGNRGRRFSDGGHLTAADVVATYGAILDPATASPHRGVLAVIDSLQVQGADRVEFGLRAPDPQFPAYLGVGIPSALALARGGNLARAPVGSGSFRLLDWSNPNRLLLERRRDGLRVAVVTVKDPNVRVMKLLRGEVHLVQNDLPAELVALLRRRPGIGVETAPGVNYSYLALNLRDPALGDPRVRQALAHAIDREAILRGLWRGGGRLAEGMFPPEHWAGAADLVPHTHDPAAARALLAAAGYGPGQPLRLTLSASSDPTRLRLATVLQAQLAAVGVDLRVHSYDWGTLFGDIRAGRFQLCALTWVGVRNPDIFRYAFHSRSLPPDGANRGGYQSAAADRLIDAARLAPGLPEQAALYRQLATLLHADLPYVPLWYEDQVLAVGAGVSGYRLAPDGNYDGLAEVSMG